MSPSPIPAVPWQITGNHWLALPCIHPADGSLHALGVLHRGARATIEFAGSAGFESGSGPALFRPAFVVNGETMRLDAVGVAWERALHWVPTLAATLGPVVVRATVFAPYGRDADSAGAVYAITLENRAPSETSVTVSLEGTLGHRQLRVRSPRPFVDAHRVARRDDSIVLEGAALPGVASIAVGADGPADVETDDADAPTYALRRSITLAPGAHGDVAFFIAAGPERDGAEATMAVLKRRGWRDLLGATRDMLRALEQTTGSDTLDRVLNRNLLFAYFYAVGRALDDAQFYMVRSRAPWNSHGVTVREWEALMWIISAVQLADPPLARELLLRACELYGYAPGSGTRYLDGTLFSPGFSLEGAAAYALAVDRYIRDTNDDELVDEPVLADTLYLSLDDVAARRHAEIPLYATDVTPTGTPASLPYTAHGNAVVALALDALKRTLDEETARGIEDPEAVRAALRRHLTREREGKAVYLAAADLAGATIADDDPNASLLWLPLYELGERSDSTYRRTARAIPADATSLARQCARIVGPDGGNVLSWLRRAPLDNGLAAEELDGEGRAVANGGDAALAGLLAQTVWYAVHALGVQP